MEAYTKLGVMDFGPQSPDYEYKNDLFATSSLESGYGSTSKASSTSSCDNTSEFDSLSSDEQSVKTESLEGASYLQEHDDDISNRSDGSVSNSANIIESIGSQISLEQTSLGNIPIQEECGGEKSSFQNALRMDSYDTIEDTAFSLDESNPPSFFRDPNSCLSKDPIQIGSQRQPDGTKNHCPCIRIPTTQSSLLKRSGTGNEWLYLNTCHQGHFISECSQEFHQRFKMTKGDRLIAINGEEVYSLRHQDIVQQINDVIHMETKQILVIERHSHGEWGDGYLEVMSCEIHLELPTLEEDGRNSLIEATLNYLGFRSFATIYNLEYKGNKKCWISHYVNGNDKYLCPGNENPDKLGLQHLATSDDPKFQFSCCHYNGFRREGRTNIALYLLTLMSKDTDGFISVGKNGRVRLKRYDYESEKMTSVENPLPHFFICRMYPGGACNLESLNHEGCFLRWDKEKNKMDIQKMDDASYQPDFLFQIYTRTSSLGLPLHH